MIHPECCAQVDGNRPTITLHSCHPDDQFFLLLVVSKEQKLAEAKRKAPKAMDTCPSCTCVAGEKILVSSKYF